MHDMTQLALPLPVQPDPAQRERTRWAHAFMAHTGDVLGQLASEDFELAVKLRDSGRSAQYAAARVRLRLKNRNAGYRLPAAVAEELDRLTDLI